MNIREYWNDKEERAKAALAHTKLMDENFAKEINESVIGSKIYSPDYEPSIAGKNNIGTETICLKVDSVTAAMKQHFGKTAILNFASFKNPGGMFLKGSKAQEECLCHQSFLFNVLKELSDYYDWNDKNKNRALYVNRAIYTPNVYFFKEIGNIDKKYKAFDVITCAAPNYSAAHRYQGVGPVENEKVLRDRIKFVLDIAMENDVETLVFGAFGCGVFGQDASKVARIAQELVEDMDKHFNRIVHGIPDDENFIKFTNVYFYEFMNQEKENKK